MSESFARETLNAVKEKLGVSDDLDELTKAEQRGYANAMEAERKLHEDRIEQLERERDGYLAERNKFELYLQRTHADWELEVAAVDALTAKLAKAVEALKNIAHGGGYTDMQIARAVLAEITHEGNP